MMDHLQHLRDELAPTVRVLRDEDADSEARGRLTDRAVLALREAGAFRAGVPAVHGGDDLSLEEATDRFRVLAEGSGAGSWVATLAYTATLAAAQLPAAGRDEIWGQDPDGYVCGSVVPSGSIVRTAAGHEVRAVVEPITGIHDASWVAVMALEERDGSSRPLLAFVPREDVVVEETWDAVGLRGTGSDRGVVVSSLVPAHRVLAPADFAAGLAARGISLPLLGQVALAAPIVGLARAAVHTALESMRDDSEQLTPRSSRPEVRAALTAGSMAADRAEALYEAARVGQGDADATAGPLDLVRSANLVAAAVEEAERAADLLTTALGLSGVRYASRSNRIWRDVLTGSRQGQFSSYKGAAAYASALFADAA
jgi:alkylation response protein AidB-like acyl-CoA dehydrogenase